jgi:tetratricopeptide (TPR) repeat protein
VGGSHAVLESTASEALALSRRAGDPAGIADALLHLGQVDPDDAERARAGAEEALPYARESGDEGLIADALSLQLLSFPIVDVDAEIAETAALYRKFGDVHGLASLYNNAGYVAIEQGSYECAAGYLDEALVLAERTGEPLRVMLAHENLGLAALFMADLEGAMAQFAEGLRLCREHGVPWAGAEGIAGVAAVAARQGESERAARLLGAADSLASLENALALRLEQEFYSPARERIGEARWRAAYAEGARLSFDEVVRLALGSGE